jgi:phage-related protein
MVQIFSESNSIKKKVEICSAAHKELLKLEKSVLEKFYAVFFELEISGKLSEPQGKKLTNGLFEIRIHECGQWMSVYSYLNKNQILILRIFQKKTQKTPSKEIHTSLQRLANFK